MKGSRLDDASSLGVLIDRPALDEIELLAIEFAEEAWSDKLLDQSDQAAARFPRMLDADAAPIPHRVDGEAGDGPLVWIGLGEDAARLRFVDARLDFLTSSSKLERELDFRSGAGPSPQHRQIGEGRRQNAGVT